MTKDNRKYADRAKYLIKAVDKRRKFIRQKALAFKGNVCAICGYNKCLNALEFHHIDDQQKDFSISNKGYTRSWETVKNEIEKCILLCANCHREVHAGITQLSAVRRIEKQGEFGEALTGNPEPSS